MTNAEKMVLKMNGSVLTVSGKKVLSDVYQNRRLS